MAARVSFMAEKGLNIINLKKPFYPFSYLLLLSHMKNTAVNFMIALSKVPNNQMLANMPELSEMVYSRLSHIEECLPNFGLP